MSQRRTERLPRDTSRTRFWFFQSVFRPASVLVCGVILGSALVGCNQFKSAEMVRANALTLSTQGRYSEALPLYQEVVERRNADARAHYELGENLLALGRASEAREQMILAYNLRPGNEAYLNGLADAFVAAGDEDQLLALLNQRIKDNASAESYLRLGAYAQKIGHADEAERAYLVAADIAGTEDPMPQRALAAFYRAIGDTPNEIKRLRMVLWFDPSDATVQNRLRELGEIPGPSFVLKPIGRE